MAGSRKEIKTVKSRLDENTGPILQAGPCRSLVHALPGLEMARERDVDADTSISAHGYSVEGKAFPAAPRGAVGVGSTADM
jgi:hypothetical protein